MEVHLFNQPGPVSQDSESAFLRGLPYVAGGLFNSLILVSAFFNSTIIAFYGIGLGYWVLSVFAIIAFYSIGGILVSFFSIPGLSVGQDLKANIGFKEKEKLTDIGLFVGSSKELVALSWFIRILDND